MYSVIDIGSNTIRLVVYRVDDEGITAILNNKYTAGLAAYVDKRGEMSEEGIERLVEVMGKFRDTVDLLPDCETLPLCHGFAAQHQQPRIRNRACARGHRF